MLILSILPGLNEPSLHKINHYLNPIVNDGNFSIIYSAPEATPGEVRIFDAIGREVYNKSINGTFIKITMNQSNWISGVYECVLFQGNSVSNKIKFMVIK
jgi:hypothetical protein